MSSLLNFDKFLDKHLLVGVGMSIGLVDTPKESPTINTSYCDIIDVGLGSHDSHDDDD
jgi:hypothetical protein